MQEQPSKLKDHVIYIYIYYDLFKKAFFTIYEKTKQKMKNNCM